jgi:hypothetical protein
MSILPQSPVVTTSVVAYRFGQQDAQAGASCCPEMYFIHHADKIAYCAGYASVAGHNLTTLQFLADNVQPVNMPTYSFA